MLQPFSGCQIVFIFSHMLSPEEQGAVIWQLFALFFFPTAHSLFITHAACLFPCKCNIISVLRYADRGGIWLFCVSCVWTKLLELFCGCRHHLMYFSQWALSCGCRLSDFVALRDSGYSVCFNKSATVADERGVLSLLTSNKYYCKEEELHN